MDLDAHYCHEGTADDWTRCLVYNINLEGIGIKLNQAIAISDRLRVRLESRGETRKFQTVVVGVNGQRISLCFVDVDEDSRAFLQGVIHHHTGRTTRKR